MSFTLGRNVLAVGEALQVSVRLGGASKMMIPKAAYVIHGHMCSGVGRSGEIVLSAAVSVVPGPVPRCGAG